MKKIISGAVFFILIAIGVGTGVNATHFLKEKSGAVLPAQTVQNVSPTDAPSLSPSLPDVGVPVTIQIPKISVAATVESVGNDSQGRMDVPKNSDNVAWYSLGYKPGLPGNSVMTGHLDKSTGAPAVFWNISKLVNGDKIIVKDGNGNQHTFSVVRTAKYPYNDFPIKEVFGPSSKPMLNLITCQGVWNSTNKLYSHRSVVFAELSD